MINDLCLDVLPHFKTHVGGIWCPTSTHNATQHYFVTNGAVHGARNWKSVCEILSYFLFLQRIWRGKNTRYRWLKEHANTKCKGGSYQETIP